MNSLIIDTATQNLYVSIVGDKNKEIIHKGKNHAAVLMKKIDELLGENKLDDIDEIIVGVGPGSYTGVRVGVVVAKMLAWSKKLTLKKISSLYIQCSGYDGIKTSTIDARRGNVFSAIYDNEELILDEKLREFTSFEKQGKIINENDYKPNPVKIVKNATVVKDVHSIVPNYLRKTEAERNKESEN